MNPLQLWMQQMEHAQRSWVEMFNLWGKTGKPH
jgi:hypothetical protein